MLIKEEQSLKAILFAMSFTTKNFYLFQEKLKKVPGFKPSRCNNMIKMESPKVVDTLDIEDMGDKVIFLH